MPLGFPSPMGPHHGLRPWPKPVVAAALLALSAIAASAEPITIQGSTTFAARLLEPYREQIEKLSRQRLDVIANKSNHGLVALLEGRARMAMISSSLAGEREIVRRRQPHLKTGALRGFEIAHARVAFVVHPANPIRKAKLADLADVLTGQIRSWQGLGGADQPIAIVTVQPGGGVPTTVRTLLLGGRPISPGREIVVEAPSHVLKVTAQIETAIGITQLGLARASGLPELETDGVIEQQLNLVTLGPPDADLIAIIEAMRQVAADNL